MPDSGGLFLWWQNWGVSQEEEDEIKEEEKAAEQREIAELEEVDAIEVEGCCEVATTTRSEPGSMNDAEAASE